MKTSLVCLCLSLSLAASLPVKAFQSEDSPAASNDGAPLDFSPSGHYLGPLDIPHIVRYPNLPLRMDLDPFLPAVQSRRKFDGRLIQLWTRVLHEASDAEIREVAALSLSRAAEMGLADIQSAGSVLLSIGQSETNVRIRYACAKALASGNIQSAAPDLILWASEGTDAQRLLIEPALIRWKHAAAAGLWRPRISDFRSTGPSFRLAAEGLSAVGDINSVAALSEVVSDPRGEHVKRMAAASAVALLDPENALITAEPLMTGDLLSRTLAVALLDNTKPESHVRMAVMCNDPSDAVAAAAWQKCFARNTELLVQHVPTGRSHRDAMVRMSAARVMRLHAGPEYSLWIHEQLSDIHIEVRNVAREMLLSVADQYPELREQIISQAAGSLRPESDDWQGMEQSLILLAQLRAPQFSQLCFDLLHHPRDEVNVAAAWMIQLYPDEAIREGVRLAIEKFESDLNGPGPLKVDVSLRETMLLQYAAIIRMPELRRLYDAQFSKDARGTVTKRAAGLWALGVLHENNPVPELTAKYVSRIEDRSGLPPEFYPVRRMSVMSLGLMRATEVKDIIVSSYKIDPPDSGIPATARWVHALVGLPVPPDLPPYEARVSGWRLDLTDP